MASSVKITTWDKSDPLEPFVAKLVQKLEPLVNCKAERGGSEFKVIVEGEEQVHLADVVISRRKEKKRAHSLKDRVVGVAKWVVTTAPEDCMVMIRRDPDPSSVVEAYSLFIRINNCPEIESVLLEVCNARADDFKGGIHVYSERIPDAGAR